VQHCACLYFLKNCCYIPVLCGHAHCHCELLFVDPNFSGRTLCKPTASRKLLNIWKYKSWLIVWSCRTNPWGTIKPVARPWTQWLQRLIVQEDMHIRTYVYIHIYKYNALLYISCVHILCIQRLNLFCQDHKINTLNYTMRSATLHRTSCMLHTFLKMSCFPPRRFSRGNTWMRHGVARFLAGCSACLCLRFCKLLVGASRFVAGA